MKARYFSKDTGPFKAIKTEIKWKNEWSSYKLSFGRTGEGGVKSKMAAISAAILDDVTDP